MHEYQQQIKAIADHYGLPKQIYKMHEELSELAVALTHNDKENIAEEMADVKIMVAQLEYLLNIKSEVKEVVAYKIERTLGKIAEENKKLL